MRAHGNDGRLGRRFAIVIGVAALGAAVMAAGASADFRSVDDPRGDTKCYHEAAARTGLARTRAKRNADIVRATACHERHAARGTRSASIGKFRSGRLPIKHRFGAGRCEWSLRRSVGEVERPQAQASGRGHRGDGWPGPASARVEYPPPLGRGRLRARVDRQPRQLRLARLRPLWATSRPRPSPRSLVLTWLSAIAATSSYGLG